jgi:pseudouridine-5'-phosphate glycosidase
MIVANPVPEKYSMDYKTINSAINIAVDEAKKRGIKARTEHLPVIKD